MKYSRNRAALAVVVTLVLILALLPIASLISLVYAAVPWTKIPDVSMGGELFVIDAYVIKDGTTYEMWYTHGKTGLSLTEIANSLSSILTDDIVNDIANQDLEGLLNDLSGIDFNALWDFLSAISTVVGYATSTDGITWTVANPQVLAGSSGGVFDSVGSPCVIKNSSTDYEMWYTHTKTNLTKIDLGDILIDMGGTPAERKAAILDLINATRTVIGYATSPDGTTWTETPEVFTGNGSGSLLDSVATPSVIKNSATEYEMWYTHGKTDLVMADLDDILADIANGTFGADDLWYILDNTSSVIGYTTSTDGINWAVSQDVLAGSSGVWDSVAAPSVIKRDSSYEMWYAHGTTDLTLTSFQTLQAEILALKPYFLALWSDLNPVDLDEFLLDLIDLLATNEMDNIKALLANTSAIIGYATSGDGTTWIEQNPTAMVGSSGSPWSSVGAPCVVYNSGVYEMWYTKGIDELTAGNLLDILLGSELPIGYAYFEERSIDLVSGWNFIGLPVSPASSDIDYILADIIDDVEIVWYYDGATDTWYYFIPDGPQNLTEMTEGKGYWVKITNPCTLIVDGTEPTLPYDIPLVADWNLISLPETPSPSTIEDVLADIINDVEIVWYYDGATATWYYFIPDGPQNLTEMTEGKAYWIKMTAPNTLTIP